MISWCIPQLQACDASHELYRHHEKKKNYNFVFANLVFVLRTSDHVIWLVDDDDDHNTSVVVVCRPPRNPKKKVTGFFVDERSYWLWRKCLFLNGKRTETLDEWISRTADTISTQLGGMLGHILRKGWIAFNLFETLLKMVQNLSQCTSLLEMLEGKGLHSPRPYRGLEYYHGNLLSKYGRNPIGQSGNISFDSKNNHFFQMIKTNARKVFFADISVFFAVKWPPKHNHQAAFSLCCLWFKSYCSSRERSKCQQDTLNGEASKLRRSYSQRSTMEWGILGRW